jgi:hypothetical protein
VSWSFGRPTSRRLIATSRATRACGRPAGGEFAGLLMGCGHWPIRASTATSSSHPLLFSACPFFHVPPHCLVLHPTTAWFLALPPPPHWSARPRRRLPLLLCPELPFCSFSSAIGCPSSSTCSSSTAPVHNSRSSAGGGVSNTSDEMSSSSQDSPCSPFSVVLFCDSARVLVTYLCRCQCLTNGCCCSNPKGSTNRPGRRLIVTSRLVGPRVRPGDQAT